MKKFVSSYVRKAYHDRDINCATTTLEILSNHFNMTLNDQVFDSAVGMHGAGGYRAQCGLVEGSLMFIGIIGRARSIPDDEIVDFCKEYAEKFEHDFTSLQCKILRPEGFAPDLPPHLCEDLTVKTILHALTSISNWLDSRA